MRKHTIDLLREHSRPVTQDETVLYYRRAQAAKIVPTEKLHTAGEYTSRLRTETAVLQTEPSPFNTAAKTRLNPDLVLEQNIRVSNDPSKFVLSPKNFYSLRTAACINVKDFAKPDYLSQTIVLPKQ